MNCFELFAGCGGLGKGFHEEGFNIVVANELEEKIAVTYKHNFKDTNVIVGDITKKEIKDKVYKNFKNKDCDCILGGPPCVAYSMSGHRNSRDPRGQLFKDYVEFVKELKPKVFVMENVKGILTILHDKPKLNSDEKKLADEYYVLEEEKLKLEAEKKQLSTKNIKNDLKKLKTKINLLNHKYYVLDEPEVSDYDFDILFKKLLSIEEAHPELITEDSPSQRVGSKPLSKFESVIHNFFSERCLDVKIADKKGNYKMPKEWYIVPFDIIEETIQLIINNQIHNYKFNFILKVLCLRLTELHYNLKLQKKRLDGSINQHRDH